MIKKLVQWFHEIEQRVTADSESETDAEGYLSYRAEWHSALFGLSVGFLAMLSGRVEVLGALVVWALRGSSEVGDLRLPYLRQFTRETGYLLGHSLAGAGVGLVARLLLGRPIPALPIPV